MTKKTYWTTLSLNEPNESTPSPKVLNDQFLNESTPCYNESINLFESINFLNESTPSLKMLNDQLLNESTPSCNESTNMNESIIFE